jgi:hypothetical protein
MRKIDLLSFSLIAGVFAGTPASQHLARAETRMGSSQAKPTTAASPVAVDACALLTPQEASAALGGPVKPPKATRTIASTLGPGLDTAVSVCTFDTAAYDMTLAVHRTMDAAAGRLRQMMQIVCDGKQMVAGVGDVACWYSAAHDELQTMKGATFLTIETKQGGVAAAALTEVAKKALSRLP